MAVIFEGIAARARTGTASADNAVEVGELSAVFARRAVERLPVRTDVAPSDERFLRDPKAAKETASASSRTMLGRQV